MATVSGKTKREQRAIAVPVFILYLPHNNSISFPNTDNNARWRSARNPRTPEIALETLIFLD